MLHTERFQLALDLVTKMTATYPVILGGVYGSTARGEDTPFSDLEMWFVVEDGCPAQGQELLVQGIAVGYQVFREGELIEILTHPDARWPFHAGVLDQLQVLHGNPTRVRDWLRLATTTPLERFHAYLAAHLSGQVVESYGRIQSCALRSDWATARYSVTEVLFEMQTALCLLNKRWVTRDYDEGLRQVAMFPKVPEGYREIFPALLVAREFGEMISLADRLVDGFWQLMVAEGIVVRNFQSVEEILI